MITIHNFPRGARGLRVMWLCEEMGLPYRMEPVSFPPSAGYRALHPLGSVPFLVDDAAGVSMSESIAIMLFVAGKYGPTPLLPPPTDARFGVVLELAVFGEAAIGTPLNPLLAAHFAAPAEEKRNWTVRGQESRIEKAIGYLGERLGKREYLVGESMTLADISVTCGIAIWTGALGKTVPENIGAYVAKLRARPAYERAVKANV